MILMGEDDRVLVNMTVIFQKFSKNKVIIAM